MVDILKKYLIIETVEQQLTDAIKNHQTVSLYYKGNKEGRVKDQTASGLRYVIPVALGLHRSTGSVVLRALVTSKGVHTKGRVRPTKWRMFRVDRITSIFPHEDANAINDAMPELYHYDDKDMSMIYAQADYGNQPQQTSAPQVPDQTLKLNKIPQGSKSVLKVPAMEPTKQQPVQPQQPVQAKPAPQPQTKPITPTAAPTNTPPVAPTNTEEPTEPEDQTQPKPIAEWYIWLNKIINY